MDPNRKEQLVSKYYSLFQHASRIMNYLLPKNKLQAKGVKLSLGFTVIKGLKIHSTGTDNTVIIEDFSQIKDCTVRIYGSHNTIVIGHHAALTGVTFHIEDDHNEIRIGHHTALSSDTHLATIEGTKIQIGDCCLFSSNIHFQTGDSHSVLDQNGKRINPSKDIVIDDHVWIGTNVTCLKNVYVAKDSIVAATSTLTKQYEQANSVIAGVPARITKSGVNWDTRRLPVDP